MNIEIVLQRIDYLCAKRHISRTNAFMESGVGKSFASNIKASGVVSKKNLQILAQYFDVPVEYLTGEIGEEELEAQNTTEVIEWLEDNGFEYFTDEHDTVVIGKNGNYEYYAPFQFQDLCRQIKEESRDGFEFVMRDHFSSLSDSASSAPAPDITSIDFALSGEISQLSEAEKKDILDYIRFKRQQRK